MLGGLSTLDLTECACRDGSYHVTRDDRWRFDVASPVHALLKGDNAARGVCTLCPNHAQCTGGATITNVRPTPGYWPDALHRNTAFFECPVADLCITSDDVAAVSGGVTDADADADVDVDTLKCPVGYTEPLCYVCADGYGRALSAIGECDKCPDPHVAVTITTGVAVVQVAVLAALVRYTLSEALDQVRSITLASVKHYLPFLPKTHLFIYCIASFVPSRSLRTRCCSRCSATRFNSTRSRRRSRSTGQRFSDPC
jgi:hypothetical protein